MAKAKKRLALVTGGTRGIGAAISIAFKEAGYDVAANYAHNDKAANAFQKKHDIPVYSWDVSHHDECEKGIGQVVTDFGRPDRNLSKQCRYHTRRRRTQNGLHPMGRSH